MVHHPATGGHATAGDHDRRPAHRADRLRTLGVEHLVEAWHAEQAAVTVEVGTDVLGMPVDRLAVHPERRERHRAVDVDRHGREPTLLGELAEVEEEHLGAVDGEGRDDHLAAAVDGPLDQLRESIDGVVLRVFTVAVGALDDDPVGLADDRWRPQQRVLLTAEVAGERDVHRLAAVRRQPESQDRRTQDVAGRLEAGHHARHDLELLVERPRDEPFERGPRVVLGVQRERGPVPRVAGPVRIAGLLLLQPSAVGQHDRHQLAGVVGDVHRTSEPTVHQAREVAAVVEVGVGHDDRVERPRRHGEVGPVALAQLLQALEQPGVHQHPAAVHLHQEAATGDGPDTSERGQQGDRHTIIGPPGSSRHQGRSSRRDLTTHGRRGRTDPGVAAQHPRTRSARTLLDVVHLTETI